MKKIIVFALLLVTTTATFSQQKNSASTLTKQDFLLKSKHQKKIAFALVGSGIGLIALGPVINLSGGILDGSDQNKGLWLSYLGGAMTLTSIPFFIASSKNKKRAASLSFINETVPQILNNSFGYRIIPSFSLKINL